MRARSRVSAAVLVAAAGLVVGVAAPAVAAPGPVARSTVSPQIRECTWQVNATNVRFRIQLHSTDSYGLLQPGDRVSGDASQTGTDGGIAFRKVFSSKFGHFGWVAQEFLSVVSCVTLEQPAPGA